MPPGCCPSTPMSATLKGFYYTLLNLIVRPSVRILAFVCVSIQGIVSFCAFHETTSSMLVDTTLLEPQTWNGIYDFTGFVAIYYTKAVELIVSAVLLATLVETTQTIFIEKPVTQPMSIFEGVGFHSNLMGMGVFYLICSNVNDRRGLKFLTDNLLSKATISSLNDQVNYVLWARYITCVIGVVLIVRCILGKFRCFVVCLDGNNVSHIERTDEENAERIVHYWRNLPWCFAKPLALLYFMILLSLPLISLSLQIIYLHHELKDSQPCAGQSNCPLYLDQGAWGKLLYAVPDSLLAVIISSKFIYQFWYKPFKSTRNIVVLLDLYLIFNMYSKSEKYLDFFVRERWADSYAIAQKTLLIVVMVYIVLPAVVGFIIPFPTKTTNSFFKSCLKRIYKPFTGLYKNFLVKPERRYAAVFSLAVIFGITGALSTLLSPTYELIRIEIKPFSSKSSIIEKFEAMEDNFLKTIKEKVKALSFGVVGNFIFAGSAKSKGQTFTVKRLIWLLKKVFYHKKIIVSTNNQLICSLGASILLGVVAFGIGFFKRKPNPRSRPILVSFFVTFLAVCGILTWLIFTFDTLLTTIFTDIFGKFSFITIESAAGLQLMKWGYFLSMISSLLFVAAAFLSYFVKGPEQHKTGDRDSVSGGSGGLSPPEKVVAKLSCRQNVLDPHKISKKPTQYKSGENNNSSHQFSRWLAAFIITAPVYYLAYVAHVEKYRLIEIQITPSFALEEIRQKFGKKSSLPKMLTSTSNLKVWAVATVLFSVLSKIITEAINTVFDFTIGDFHLLNGVEFPFIQLKFELWETVLAFGVPLLVSGGTLICLILSFIQQIGFLKDNSLFRQIRQTFIPFFQRSIFMLAVESIFVQLSIVNLFSFTNGFHAPMFSLTMCVGKLVLCGILASCFCLIASVFLFLGEYAPIADTSDALSNNNDTAEDSMQLMSVTEA